MSKINIKLDPELVEKVKTIAENKFPLRNITSYAEATREALIEFVKRNQKHAKKTKKPTTQNQTKTIETVQEEIL